MTTTIYLILTGVFAGILAGFFGVGGGILIVPALVYFLRYDHHAAVGTSLVALLLPVGLLAVIQYYRAGKIGPTEIKSGLIIAAGLFCGALLGSMGSISLAPTPLRRAFAIFLCFVAARLWWSR